MENNVLTTMVMLPQSVWEGMQSDLQEMKEMLKTKTTEELNGQWVESSEARKMLGVSAKTWQSYRDKRIIPFSQVGRKIYVKRKDLEDFLNKHNINNK